MQLGLGVLMGARPRDGRNLCCKGFFKQGIERQERGGYAVHVKRGHQKAGPYDEPDFFAFGTAQNFIGNQVHFKRRCGAQIIEQKRVGLCLANPGEKLGHQQRCRLLGAHKVDEFNTGFAMDAKPQFRLAMRHAVLAANAGQRAGIERNAKRYGGLGGLARRVGNG